jgi:hypothetical protein
MVACLRRPAVQLAITAAAVSVAAYGWTLFGASFFSDDFTWLWHGQKVGLSLTHLWTYRVSSFFSPVINAYWAWMLLAVGPHAPYYFAFNLAVHATVAWLAGLLALRLGGSRLAAALVTVCVGIGGAAYEAIIWAAANMHSFTTLFVLVAVHAYLSFLRHGRAWSAVLAVTATALAYMTKETAIVTLPLLAGVAVLERRASFARTRRHLALAGTIAAVSAAYFIAQMRWQQGAMTINAGLWSPEPAELLRMPIVIADHVVPMAWLALPYRWLIVASGLAVFIAAALRRRLPPAAVYGLFWGAAASLPTVFFHLKDAWMPLDSRYGYLPRVGTIIAFTMTVFALFGKRGRTWATAVIMAAALSQAAYAAVTINHEYRYVYATGRSLKVALEQAHRKDVERLYVLPNRPFENNPAHIIGAVRIFTSIEESSIVFIEKEMARPAPTAHEGTLAWDAKAHAYRLEIGK